MKNDLFVTTIPPGKLMGVQKALKQVFNSTTVDDIQLLAGGLSTSLVYRIVVKGHNYLLRIVMQPDEMHNPPRQHICMGHAALHGIAPAIYYTDDDDALAITDFIEVKPIREGFTSKQKLITALSSTVKAIHSLPLFPKLVNFMDGVDLFIQQFKALQMFPEQVMQEHFTCYAEIQEAYPRYDEDMVSSHNDLNPNNILFDGQKIWVIDWEAAFQNDRYVDLAIMAQTFVSDAQDEELFLQVYFGNELDDLKHARFFLMQQICRMYYAMLMFKLAAAQKPVDYQHNANMDVSGITDFGAMLASGQISMDAYEGKLLYGKILLNTMLAKMKTERFKQAIAAMA
jgi:tRNA A-37 threonylcarbamoyl transferase component Bud32